MTSHNNHSGAKFSFAHLVGLLQQPPFEPCDRELEYLSPAEYEAAFIEIVRLYRVRITRFIARITEDPASSAELAQEVFLNLYKARISFEGSYIYRAARNAAYGELRRRARERHVLYAHWTGTRLERNGKAKELEAPDTRPLADAELVARERENALSRAFEILPERFRVPLLLLAEGKSHRQITEIVQANMGTVKSRICRGKTILRRKLRAYL